MKFELKKRKTYLISLVYLKESGIPGSNHLSEGCVAGPLMRELFAANKVSPGVGTLVDSSSGDSRQPTLTTESCMRCTLPLNQTPARVLLISLMHGKWEIWGKGQEVTPESWQYW